MPDRTLTLGAVVGHLKQSREASNRAGTALRNGLGETHVTGFNRKFTPDDDEQREQKRLLQKNTDTYKAVALRVRDQLREDALISGETLDWALTQDIANCTAKADVVVNGEVLLAQVPISHLLHLQKHFAEYKAVILTKIPILDPTVDWEWDEVQQLWRARPEKTGAFVKRDELVVVPGTDKSDKHAPAWSTLSREMHIGEWESTNWSSALPEQEKRALLARADTLLSALKEAIAVANHTPAQKHAGGSKLYGFLLGS
jgi:hypothetical protein